MLDEHRQMTVQISFIKVLRYLVMGEMVIDCKGAPLALRE